MKKINQKILRKFNDAGNSQYPFNHINQLKKTDLKIDEAKYSTSKNKKRTSSISDTLVKIACSFVFFSVAVLAIGLATDLPRFI